MHAATKFHRNPVHRGRRLENRRKLHKFITQRGGRIETVFVQIKSPFPSLPKDLWFLSDDGLVGLLGFPVSRIHYPNGTIKHFCEHFEKHLKRSTVPLSIEDEFSKFLDAQKAPTNRKKAGRLKVFLNQETGEIVNVGHKARRVIRAWEADSEFESIRRTLHPTTRTPPQKKIEIGKIRRILRRYKHLLNRSYDAK